MTDVKKPSAKITARRRVFNGFFKLDEYDIEMDKHDGSTQKITRLMFERGDAVTILGYDPNRDEVLLISELRTALLVKGDYPFSDTLPAGMIDKGENALAAAKREMVEETGLTLQKASVIHAGAYVSPGGTSERIALVFGVIDTSKAGGIHGKPGEGEDIKSVVVTSDEFIRRAESGEMKDMKTIMAAFWFAAHKPDLQKKYATSKKPKPPQP